MCCNSVRYNLIILSTDIQSTLVTTDLRTIDFHITDPVSHHITSRQCLRKLKGHKFGPLFTTHPNLDKSECPWWGRWCQKPTPRIKSDASLIVLQETVRALAQETLWLNYTYQILSSSFLTRRWICCRFPCRVRGKGRSGDFWHLTLSWQGQDR